MFKAGDFALWRGQRVEVIETYNNAYADVQRSDRFGYFTVHFDELLKLEA